MYPSHDTPHGAELGFFIDAADTDDLCKINEKSLLYTTVFVYGADTGGSLDWLRPPFGFIFILIMATHFSHWISFRPKIIRLIYKSACKLNVVIWIYIQK